MEVDRRAEGIRVLDHAAVEVRVTDRDRADPAERPQSGDDVVVDVGDHVPEHVSAGRGDQERALADRGRRDRADAGDAGTFRLDPARVPGRAQLGQGRPLLAVPADVLALVLADRAARAGLPVLDSAGTADRHVGAHGTRYTGHPAARGSPGRRDRLAKVFLR